MSVIFIEMYGIPGCGKSTISRKLYNNFAKKGYNVILYSDRYRENESTRYWKIKLILSNLSIHALSVFIDYFKLFISIEHRTLFDFKYCFFSIINYLFYIDICKTNQRNMKELSGKTNIKENCNSDINVILCDEGIVQYVFSLFYDRKIKNIKPIKRIIKKLEREFKGIKFVSIETDNDIIIERLKNRKSSYSRLDREETCHQPFVIKIQELNMKMVDDLIQNDRKIKVSSAYSPDIVSNFIVRSLITEGLIYEENI